MVYKAEETKLKIKDQPPSNLHEDKCLKNVDL